MQQLTEPAIARVTLYIPAGLPEALRATGDPAAEQLAASCQRTDRLGRRPARPRRT